MGVNECGSKPRRLVEPIKIINEISIRDQVCPLLLWMDIICFKIVLINQCWNEIRRLLIKRFDFENIMDGNMTIRITIGNPIIVGVMKEANKFSFI